MITLSTGEPSTLGNWLAITNEVFGEGSIQSRFIQEKMKASKDGENEEVIAPEEQMLHMLGKMEEEDNGPNTGS